MKKTRRFAAIAMMTACLAVPMMAVAPVMMSDSTAISASAADTYSITINNAAAGHTYEAYQIFVGDLTEETAGDVTTTVLSNIKWGSGQTTNTAGTDATDVAEGLVDEDDVKALIDTLTLGTATASVSEQTDGAYVISGLAPGYYLVKDKDGSLDGAYDAYTSYIVKVVANVSATPKSALPSVDKQVYDNDDGAATGDNAGWGETADWMINDTYGGTTQFKLIATIPADTDLADYESYKLVFTDTMSDGVTFDSIDSVTVGTKELALGTDYSTTAAANQAGGSWTLTVTDVTDHVTDLSAGATVTVIYNAHLNENADVTTATGNIVNQNKVGLEYSNNPNWTGSGEEELGKAPEDTVWVATYQILNTKVDGEDNTKKLEGAVFELHDADGAIAVIYDDDLGAYRPIGTNETAEAVKSDANGVFNFVGIDAGTYTLKEITPPAGYNKLDSDLTITIEATHAEDAGKTSSTVTLTGTNTNNTIENNKGASLPGTGGIGTTIFYVVGGTMVAGASVYLISKKRMNKNQD